MMKNKKIIITLLTILIVMLVMIGESFAANFSAGLTPNSSKVSKGDVVNVTLKLSSINVDGGINSVTATLKYDSDVLSISKDDAKGLNDWTVSFNPDNGKIVFDKAETITEDTEIATFSFKVAENTSATTSTIKLVSVEAGNSSLDEAEKISDISTVITISSASAEPSSSESASPSASESTEPSSSESVSPITSVSPTSNGTTTYNGNMADTGSAPSYVLPLIIAIAVLGIVSFINYKKLDNKQ